MMVLAIDASTCSLSNSNLNYNQNFYSTPQADSLSFCSQWSSNSCCKASYATSVSQRTDIISSAISSLISVSSGDQCDVALEDLRCMPCSPDQNLWFNYFTYEVDLSLCPQFCQRLYQQCSAAPLASNASTTVASAFSASEFCYRLLNPLFHVNLQNTLTCFDNTAACTPDDYIGVYTTCYNDRRNAYFFKNPSSNCTGGTQLPDPVYNLLCDIPCTRGTYLPIGATSCQNCPKGTFSLGGALAIYSWKTWPNLNYKTYVTDLNGVTIEGLPGWVLNQTWIDSGDYLDDNQNSIFEFEDTWVRDGTIKFNWRVNGEPTYDGMTFTIDGVTAIPFTSTHMSGYSTFNVSAGLHKFKFVYSKDYSVSVGDDRAFIYDMFLEGVEYADSKCIECPPGKFNNQTGQEQCNNCPFGTFSNEYGSVSCQTCPEGTFAFEGSTICQPMAMCTTRDYEMKTTACRAGVVMDRVYNWKSPKICNDSALQLPPNEYGVPCFDCQPGQYRAQDDFVCRPCPPGTYLIENTTTCANCEAGSYAPRLTTVTRWDTWPEGWTFSCDGELCANPAWRLLGTTVDSGIGHGPYSSPTLEIPLHIEGENSMVTVNFRYDCSNYCIVGFYTENDLLGFRYSTENVPYRVASFTLLPGTRKFGIYFYRYSSQNYGTDRIVIRNITISGDSSGGAVECLRCGNGTTSPGLSSFCTNCTAGSFSSNGDACQQCPANFYSPINGSSSCTKCGQGTFSSQGATDCQTDCTFSPFASVRLGDDSLIKYDLSPLKKSRMWGPVFDSLNYQYYFSVCSKDYQNTPCIDIEGKPIQSYACQRVSYYSIDLGNTLAYYLRPNAPSDEGLIVSVTGGDNAGCRTRRSLNMTFICDPLKGEGSPRPPSTGVIEVGTSCQYNVIWESLYACPVCSMRDITFDVGACVNNYANKTYRWVDAPNPKKCHGGISLPPPELVQCSTLVCAAGNWQPPGSSICVPTDPGFFSVGGAYYYYDWTSLPYEFTLACSTAGCTNWRLQDSVIASGQGDSSLFLELVFSRAGTISFTYRTNAVGDASLSFSLDNTIVFSTNSTQIKYTTQYVDVPQGKHVFRWKFTGGVVSTSETRPVFAKISTIVAMGTTSGTQYPCLAGTYSTGGATICTPCPANTFSSAGSSGCTPCLPDTYSIPQSSSCLDKPVCNSTHYQQYFTPCDAATNTRTSYFLLSEPVICKNPNIPANRTLSCSQQTMVCPLGQIAALTPENTYVCTPCGEGTYPDFDTHTCQPVPAGSFATSVSNNFKHDVLVIRPFLPAGYTTGCEGTCGSDGWRVVNRNISGVFHPAVDSGFHGNNEVDSYMKYTGAFVKDGSISFEYQVTGDAAVGLEFFIDGVMQPNVWRTDNKRATTVSFPVKRGDHTFMWLYHQAPNNQGMAMVQNLLMNGVDRGSYATPCPPGTYSSSPAQQSCDLCKPGTYNGESGQTSCKFCPIGEFSWQSGATDCLVCENPNGQQAGMSTCLTECTYEDKSNKMFFNITTLGVATYGPISDVLSNKVYYINPCKTTSDKCKDANGNKISTYICEVDPFTGIGSSAGQNAKFDTQIDPASKQVYLSVEYRDGDSTGCDANVSRSTEVVFVCDPTSNQVTFSGSLGCKRAITWRSRAACRTCSTNTNPDENPDYVVFYGECMPDATKGVVMYRNATCNGPAVITSARIKCEYVKKKSIPASAVIVVILGVSALIAVIVVVVIKNQRLKHQYTSLLTQSINLENDSELKKIQGSTDEESSN